MAINYMGHSADLTSEQSITQGISTESKILFGTVLSVDPLEIQMQDTDAILPSEHFYPIDAVLVKKARVIVHRAYGKPKEIEFNGSANEVSNQLNSLLFNLQGSGTSFNLQFSAPQGTSGGSVATPASYGIAGPGFSRWLTMNNGSFSLALPNLTALQTMQAMRASMKLRTDVHFHIEFIEEPENEFRQDEPQQPQTVAMECILWCGIKVGDIIQMTSHNHNQKFQISRIINRKRDPQDYEQAVAWCSRINDVHHDEHMIRH